jgi:hypothetical protein
MCPFIDKDRSCCAAHWKLPNLSATFLHCINDYAACPVYREILSAPYPAHESERARQLEPAALGA